jgi:hypothetical protein
MARPIKSTKSAPETDTFLCYESSDSWVNVKMEDGKFYIDSCNMSGDLGLSPRQAEYFANKILLMILDIKNG